MAQWLPRLPPNTSISERWQSSTYVTETTLGRAGEWRLVLEQPVAALLEGTHRVSRDELDVEIDRERAAAFGIPAALVGQNVRALMAGDKVADYHEGNDTYDIKLRLPPEVLADPVVRQVYWGGDGGAGFSSFSIASGTASAGTSARWARSSSPARCASTRSGTRSPTSPRAGASRTTASRCC